MAMSEQDPTAPSNLTRRTLVILGAGAACGALAAEEGTTHPAPPAEAPATAPAPSREPVDVGALSDFPEDGVDDRFRQSHKFLLIRHEGKLYAPTARCTHKGCVLKAIDRTTIQCPCHASRFDLHGIPTGGPAQGSLYRYAIALKEGRVVVNQARQFDERAWDDPQAFVKLP
jgi:nitrite reductase/ring-hydroxylating ferredoxin subunit